MEKLNLPPFWIGQRVIATMNNGGDVGTLIRKGNEYTIRQISRLSCGCWVVDVGASRTNGATGVTCAFHNDSEILDGNYWWAAAMFAPIEERFISFAEVIAIESQLIGAN